MKEEQYERIVKYYDKYSGNEIDNYSILDEKINNGFWKSLIYQWFIAFIVVISMPLILLVLRLSLKKKVIWRKIK